jgi:hypothetical protein
MFSRLIRPMVNVQSSLPVSYQPQDLIAHSSSRIEEVHNISHHSQPPVCPIVVKCFPLFIDHFSAQTQALIGQSQQHDAHTYHPGVQSRTALRYQGNIEPYPHMQRSKQKVNGSASISASSQQHPHGILPQRGPQPTSFRYRMSSHLLSRKYLIHSE